MVASYQPPDPCKTDPAVSFKPQTTYKQPQYPFQDDTVQKLSYVPWPICNKEVLPWAAKNKYSTPCSPMDGNTIYNTSYLPNCPGDRQKPIKHEPAGNLLSDTRNFADTTIYRESYLPVNAACCKQPAFKAIGNLTVPTTKFGGDTTQKHDYRCWPGAQAAQAVLPCNRNLLGDGPMQSLTTQKHDYVPKPFSKMDPIIPPHQMLSSNCPMEDTSIMVASYQPPDPCKMDPAVSFKPQTRYRQPQYPFQDDTIQKLSYVPWPICNKEMLPWAGKARYKCPTSPMEADTVYKTSYFPPGRFVPAGQVCNPCTPCSPKVATSSCKGAACFDQCCRGINACG